MSVWIVTSKLLVGQSKQKGIAYEILPQLDCTDVYLLQAEKAVDRFVFGQSIEYVCSDGFYLDGEAHLYCQSGGNWSQPSPVCEPIHCLIPPTVERADVK